MRDDLFCFVYLGRRVCVRLDAQAPQGWSYTIDGAEEAPAAENMSIEERWKLEEAGMVARDRIRLLQQASYMPRAGGRADAAPPL